MSPRTRRRLFLSAGAGLALLWAALASIDLVLTARIKREAVQVGGRVGHVAASPLTGRVVLHDLALPIGDGLLRVGRIPFGSDLALVSPAFAAQNVTLADISVETSVATYRMPRVEVTGSSLGRAELVALFDKAAAEPLAKRLSALSAATVTIPELAVEQMVPDGKQTVTYRDIALRDIAAGSIGSITASGGTIKGSGGTSGAVDGTFGPIGIKDFDLVLTTRLYTDKAGPGDKEPKLLYSAFSMEKIAFKAETGGVVGIERIAGRDFKARPTEVPWVETMRLLSETAELEKLPPAERARLSAAMLDIVEAFDIGTVEVVNMTVDDPAKEAPGKGRIARIAFSGGATPEVRVEGLEVTTPEATVRLGLMSFSGFSFRPTLQAAKEHLGKPEGTAGDVDPRRFIPELGTIKIADIGIDVPDEQRERIKMAVKGFEASAGKPLNGIPTTLRAGVWNVAFALPPTSQESGFKDLIEMGYATLDLSFLSDGAWNEAGNEFVVKELSVSGVDMGSLALRGTLGNVTKDVFSTDPAVAQVALVGTTVKTAHLTLENSGLMERAIAREAKKQGRKPEELRAEFGMGAAVAIPAVLGNSRGAKDLANAAARFIAKPGRLEVSIRTKDPGGLGLADFMAAGGEPAAILDRLDITAAAE